MNGMAVENFMMADSERNEGVKMPSSPKNKYFMFYLFYERIHETLVYLELRQFWHMTAAQNRALS